MSFIIVLCDNALTDPWNFILHCGYTNECCVEQTKLAHEFRRGATENYRQILLIHKMALLQHKIMCMYKQKTKVPTQHN